MHIVDCEGGCMTKLQKHQMMVFNIGLIYKTVIGFINKWVPLLALYWILATVIAIGVYWKGSLGSVNLSQHAELTFRIFAIELVIVGGYYLELKYYYSRRGLNSKFYTNFDPFIVTPVLTIKIYHTNGQLETIYLSEGVHYGQIYQLQRQLRKYFTVVNVKSHADILFLNTLITPVEQAKLRSHFEAELLIG